MQSGEALDSGVFCRLWDVGCVIGFSIISAWRSCFGLCVVRRFFVFLWLCSGWGNWVWRVCFSVFSRFSCHQQFQLWGKTSSLLVFETVALSIACSPSAIVEGWGFKFEEFIKLESLESGLVDSGEFEAFQLFSVMKVWLFLSISVFGLSFCWICVAELWSLLSWKCLKNYP